MALALSPHSQPARSAQPAYAPQHASGVRLSAQCRARRNLDSVARYEARRREVQRRRRRFLFAVCLTFAAAACLGVRALASRGDGTASLPTVTPLGSKVLFAEVPAESTAAVVHPEQFYVVQAGDTLWSIASTLTEGDLAHYVDRLIRLNGSTSILVGQRLVLPAD